jgi:O-antigen ligase
MANPRLTSRLLAIGRAATLITIAVMAWYANLPLNLPQFDTASLPLPYLAPAVSLAEVTALMAITTYALAGWPNLKTLRSGWRKIFTLSLVGLILLETLSIAWSVQRGLAAMQTLHVVVWAAFALMIACADWSASAMTLALFAGLLANSLAGFIEIGMQPLVQSIPQNSGLSVVFNGAERWLRIYGLSPHPNLLGGHLAVGIILMPGLFVTHRRIQRLGLIAAWLIIGATLLLTFSRSAWLAVVGGGIAALIMLARSRLLNRLRLKPLLVLIGIGLIIVSVFVLSFQPFLVNRFEVTTTPFETRAITDRIVTAQLALQIFAAQPLTGVGISQFIVVAAHDLTGTSLDWVHNVPLLAAAELGLGGILLIVSLMISLGAIGVEHWRTRSISLWQALVGGGLIALIVVMQFDHYVWTTPQGGLLWAWLVGWWLRAEHTTVS